MKGRMKNLEQHRIGRFKLLLELQVECLLRARWKYHLWWRYHRWWKYNQCTKHKQKYNEKDVIEVDFSESGKIFEKIGSVGGCAGAQGIEVFF